MHIYRGFLLFFWFIATLFLLSSLITFSPTDQSWLYESVPAHPIHNVAGSYGAHIAGMLFYYFGGAAFLFILLAAFIFWGICIHFKNSLIRDRIAGTILGIFGSSASLAFIHVDIRGFFIPGGVLGTHICSVIQRFGQPIAAAILFITMLLASILLFRFTWISSITRLSALLWRKKKKVPIRQTKAPKQEVDVVHAEKIESPMTHEVMYLLPQKTLFHHTTQKERSGDDTRLKNLARVLEEKLEHFGIYGNVVDIKPGPLITLFTYQPRVDMKISAIVAREDDLALALKTMSLRIIAPIPGTAVIGFEVANEKRAIVHFGDCLQALEPIEGYLPIIVGQDTGGDAVAIDIVETPHLLIAGSTGSGKSVALHSVLVSLLCNKTPDELKLILIDPKRLELNQFAGCPHLVFPIITHAGQAIQALHWAVSTMEERYERLAEANVRTIQEYHTTYGMNAMPYIVIVIDELADLMMTGHKAVEELITRLAQMARAAGMHLIAATQRPSVDIVTGLIKVNFPSRIAFKVASKVDSRTILDVSGAEKLLGKGDMLFLTSQGRVRRLHGAHVSESEIARVVTFINEQRKPEFVDLASLKAISQDDTEDAELYPHILNFLNEVDEISISLLQRRFKIGYNRSARFIERLEGEGKITPATGGKMRRVIKSL